MIAGDARYVNTILRQTWRYGGWWRIIYFGLVRFLWYYYRAFCMYMMLLTLPSLFAFMLLDLIL